MLKVSSTLKMGSQNQLIHDFLEVSENSDMKELVEQIPLPYEELAKYTSMLEDASIEYQHCKHCKGLAACQNEVCGYAYLPRVKNKSILFDYQACRYQQKQIKEESHLRFITCFEVAKEVKKAKMKDIITEDENRLPILKSMNRFIKNYPKEKKGFYLYGSFGSGKTYLLAAMLNELAKKEVKSAIVFWPEFLRDLKSSMNEKDEFRRKFEAIQKVPLLVIDDIGAENATAWGRDEIICPILQYRMQEELPTFFTSNLDLKSLEQHFSMTKDGVEVIKARRVMERLRQLTTPIELVSKNFRK